METVTTDLCETAFPPAFYGSNPGEIESTIQEVIETIFRDEDGMIRSGVYGRTMKPLRLEDVKDRPYGIGCCSENEQIPNEIKPLFMNYENAGQASGKYIKALLTKYRATGDKQCVNRARRTYQALVTLWNNAAVQEKNPEEHRFGRGFIPKPFAGIKDVSEMTECSPDQYADITLGLERYYNTVADAEEKKVIEAMVCSFAQWWSRHDYATSYEGGTCYWKLRDKLVHVMSFFTYLNALAFSFDAMPSFRRDFEFWHQRLTANYSDVHGLGPNETGLTLHCMERLNVLEPGHKAFWSKVIDPHARRLIECATSMNDNLHAGVSGSFQVKAYVAWYLCTAARVTGNDEYRKLTRQFLHAYGKRADFYHVSRGCRIENLSPIIAGDDYRNMFWSEGHIAWMGAYWELIADGDKG